MESTNLRQKFQEIIDNNDVENIAVTTEPIHIQPTYRSNNAPKKNRFGSLLTFSIIILIVLGILYIFGLFNPKKEYELREIYYEGEREEEEEEPETETNELDTPSQIEKTDPLFQLIS